jgi:hypothetical protein
MNVTILNSGSFFNVVWEDNIKMNFQEFGGGRGDWIELAQDRDRWRALVSTVKKTSGFIKCGEFLG